LPPRERHHVEIGLAGQRRVVTACHRHRDQVEAGREPLIRAEEANGGPRPWFVVPHYDAYSQYRPEYSLGLLPSVLPSQFQQAAMDLSQPVGVQGWSYADDDWSPDYRSSYWDRHDRWERSQGWYESDYSPSRSARSDHAAPETAFGGGVAPETSFGGRAAPETSFGGASAPEQSFGDRPSPAETAFAQSISENAPSSSTGGGSDRS
jgi:hypothetical protein